MTNTSTQFHKCKDRQALLRHDLNSALDTATQYQCVGRLQPCHRREHRQCAFLFPDAVHPQGHKYSACSGFFREVSLFHFALYLPSDDKVRSLLWWTLATCLRPIDDAMDLRLPMMCVTEGWHSVYSHVFLAAYRTGAISCSWAIEVFTFLLARILSISLDISCSRCLLSSSTL